MNRYIAELEAKVALYEQAMPEEPRRNQWPTLFLLSRHTRRAQGARSGRGATYLWPIAGQPILRDHGLGSGKLEGGFVGVSSDCQNNSLSLWR